jgi:putative transposase
MPRIARSALGGVCYHIINRGNGRSEVFHKDFDFESFLKCLAHACIEQPMPVYGYCLMPDHFHLVVQPVADGDLSTWMHWLTNAHVRRYHQHHKTSGHLWQGRFKSFPIEEDEHLLSVLRYVERNPVRANLVRSAERWPWSSTRAWVTPTDRPAWLTEGPLKRGANWLTRVNDPQTTAETEALRRCINRGTPYGNEKWVRLTAKSHDLESTLRPRGRPRKEGL